jgi:hypothetical protein
MANCPECWQPKPLFSERCPHCNTKVSVGDTFHTTTGLFGFRVLRFLLILGVLAAIIGPSF